MVNQLTNLKIMTEEKIMTPGLRKRIQVHKEKVIDIHSDSNLSFSSGENCIFDPEPELESVPNLQSPPPPKAAIKRRPPQEPINDRLMKILESSEASETSDMKQLHLLNYKINVHKQIFDDKVKEA